jgi:hypothetical protein
MRPAASNTLAAELGEELFFNFNGAVVGGEDFDFVVFELGGGEALGVDQCLLAFVIGWARWPGWTY